MLIHMNRALFFDSIISPQLHAAAVHIEFAGDQLQGLFSFWVL